MSLPKYSELYLPFLTTIQDGAVHSVKEVRDRLASSLHLSEDDFQQSSVRMGFKIWLGKYILEESRTRDRAGNWPLSDNR